MYITIHTIFCFCSAAKSCLTLCDPMDCSIPGSSVLHYLPEFVQIHVIDLIIGGSDGIPLQYSCLENPVDAGAWWAAVHGVAKTRTRLSDFIFTFHFHALEREMATHSSILAWRIPETEQPSGLPSVGSHRVGHD